MKKYRLPILAGFLIGTSYIPFPPWALLFCLTPLFIFWHQDITPRQAFIGGWITQFILNCIGFPWIAHTAIEFGHFPIWGGVLTELGFASIAHLYYAAGGALGLWIVNRAKLDRRFRLPIMIILFAICQQIFPTMFPWHFGYPWLWADLPGAQFADVIGFDGLNLLTILVNALIAHSILSGLFSRDFFSVSQLEKTRRAKPLALGLALVAAVNLIGMTRAEPWKKNDAEVSILAVQGNIGNFDKLMVEKGRNFREPIIKKYVDLSRQGLLQHPEADIMIWPETAFPDILDVPYQSERNVTPLRNLVTESHVPLLTGSYSYERFNRETYNGFFFLNSRGMTPETPYRKTILLVFGETFPFADVIPYMEKLFPDQGSFGRGTGPKVLNIETKLGQSIRLGAQICYEGLYPWFSADLARKGAQIFSNVTNDSWFGRDFEPYQHLYMTMARAIEFRRPLIRSTNTGITTAILATGEFLQFSPQNGEWTGIFKIPYQSHPQHTTYESLAGYWIWVLLALLMVLIGLAFRRRERT